MSKIGTIPFTDSNGTKHYLEVHEDGSVILPDGSVRKIRKEILEKLLEQRSQQEQLNNATATAPEPTGPDKTKPATAADNPSSDGTLDRDAANAKVDAPELRDDRQYNDEQPDNPKPEPESANNLNLPAPEEESKSKEKSKAAKKEKVKKEKAKKEKDPAKQKKIKKAVSVFLVVVLSASLVGAAGFLAYQRGGLFNDVLQMVDKGQQVISTEGVMKIEYYAVITDSNGVEHEIKLSSMTLDDMELKAMEDSSGHSILK